jgi:excisionase family DNA binding protein
MELISIQEAADQLKVHPNTIRNFIKQAQLPAIKIGGTIRIDQAELDRITKGNK